MQTVLSHLACSCLSKKWVKEAGDHYFGLRGCLCAPSSSVLTSFPWTANTGESSYHVWARFLESRGEVILEQLLLTEFPAHRCPWCPCKRLQLSKSPPSSTLLIFPSDRYNFLLWVGIYPTICHLFAFFKALTWKINEIINLHNKCSTF